MATTAASETKAVRGLGKTIRLENKSEYNVLI